MPHDVFVSHASEDKPTADAVCATLENKGIRCWIAPRDILPGADWGGAIVDAITASRVMVLVYSAKANDSPQIKREVERAVHRGLTIIPFRIEDVPMSRTLEFFISMPHWLDALTPPLQHHLDRLAETVRVNLERSGATVGPPIDGHTTDTGQRREGLSRDLARRIGQWVIGGTDSPTLAEVFVPHSDRLATAILIAASVVVISLFAQLRAGPIWLQPVAVLLAGAVLGSRGGGVAAAVYVALGILGFPVLAPATSAWTVVEYRAPYVRYGLGYLVGLIAAAFAVGWLAERRSWDRRRSTAARLALVGIALMYVPGVVWLEVAALLMREASGPAGVLPSIPMLVLTLLVLAFALPWAWTAVSTTERAASESAAAAVEGQNASGSNTGEELPR